MKGDKISERERKREMILLMVYIIVYLGHIAHILRKSKITFTKSNAMTRIKLLNCVPGDISF